VRHLKIQALNFEMMSTPFCLHAISQPKMHHAHFKIEALNFEMTTTPFCLRAVSQPKMISGTQH